ncbi:MAG: hypothetical protein WBB22_06775 [Anaerolineae bacterium]
MSQNIAHKGSAEEEPGSESLGFLQRHSLVAYFGLAYAISWLLWRPLVASAQGPLDVRIPPSMHFLGSIGSILAAFIVTAVTAGSTGVRELVGRMGEMMRSNAT